MINYERLHGLLPLLTVFLDYHTAGGKLDSPIFLGIEVSTPLSRDDRNFLNQPLVKQYLFCSLVSLLPDTDAPANTVTATHRPIQADLFAHDD